MNETQIKEDLSELVQKKAYRRAANLASMLGKPQDEIIRLQEKALWQMSAVYRNGSGTKRIAMDYGLSRQKVKELLMRMADESGKGNEARELEPSYDHGTATYISFKEWLELFDKRWERL
jgi:hypothetical protein